jgi:hypothetical protein
MGIISWQGSSLFRFALTNGPLSSVESFWNKKRVLPTSRRLVMFACIISKWKLLIWDYSNINAERPKDQRTEDEKGFINVLTPEQIIFLLDNVREYKLRVLFSTCCLFRCPTGWAFLIKVDGYRLAKQSNWDKAFVQWQTLVFTEIQSVKT